MRIYGQLGIVVWRHATLDYKVSEGSGAARLA